jgi:hypothetical protein
MRAMIFAICCSLTPLAAQSQTYQASNRLTVVPLNATDFEVIESRGQGARGIWCAAADFVDTQRRRPADNRIYVKSARGPSVSAVGRMGVVFTTDARDLNARTSYSVTVREPGIGLPVDHAIQFCKDYLIELQDTVGFRPLQP